MSDDTKQNTKPKSGKKTNNDDVPPAETVPTSSGGFIWLVVFIAVIGVGGWAFWPEIGPSVKPIIAKIRGISTPKDFAPAPAPAPAPATVMPTPPSVLGAPAGVSVYQPQPASSPTAKSSSILEADNNIADALASMQSKLVAIEQRLSELENRPQLTRDPTSSAQVLVLATTQLAARLGGEGSFAGELNVLEKVSGQSEIVIAAIGKLRPHADAGIPTTATLRAHFNDVAEAIARARLKGNETGWMGEIKDKFGSLITIRRTDPATTTDPVERAIAMAEAALEVGALDEAVQAVSSIEGDAGSVAAPWLGDAGARLLAQSTLKTLNNYALSQLGGVQN